RSAGDRSVTGAPLRSVTTTSTFVTVTSTERARGVGVWAEAGRARRAARALTFIRERFFGVGRNSKPRLTPTARRRGPAPFDWGRTGRRWAGNGRIIVREVLPPGTTSCTGTP